MGIVHLRDCEICVEFGSSHIPKHYVLRGVPDEGRILESTEHFVLVPDYAPLVPGHLLLFARVHALSMADYLSSGGSTREDELLQMLERYSARHTDYGIIEHGSTLDVERDRPCIAHAHLHLLPITADDLKAEVRTARWSDIAQVSGREYVLVGDSESLNVAMDWRPPVRQYARSLVGRLLGLPELMIYSDTCIVPDTVAATITEWNTNSVK